MFNKYIFVAIAFLVVTSVSNCATEKVFAQEPTNYFPQPTGATPPRPTTPPQQFSGGNGATESSRATEGVGGQVRPPFQDQSGNAGAERIMPPQGGNFDTRKMPPPPFPNEQRNQLQPGAQTMPTAGGQNTREGQPVQQGTMPQRQTWQAQPTTSQGGSPYDAQNRMQGENPGKSQGRGPAMQQMEEGNEATDDRGQNQQKQQLSNMKRNMSGMAQGIGSLQKAIDRLKKKGIAVPAEVESLVSELTAATTKVKGATELTDDVEEALETIQDKGQDIGEWGQKLGMLEQWPKMIAQTEKQMKRLTDSVAKAKKKKGADAYTAVISKVEASILEASTKFAEIKQQGSSGHIETAMESLQDLPDLMQEAQQNISVLEQLSNVTRMITNTEKEIAAFEKQVQRLSKKGTNVSKVTAIIGEVRAKLLELKALGTKSSTEPQDFYELMQSLDEHRKEATDAFNALNGNQGGQEGSVVKAFERLRNGR